MRDATQTDDTRRIDSPAYPPSVALATAWHRYRWTTPEDRPRLRLTRRGRVVRDLAAGAAAFAVVVLAQPLSEAYFTAVLWAGQLIGTAA